MKLHRNYYYLGVAIIVAALILGYWFYSSKLFIPDDFYMARENSTKIAKIIVDDSSENLNLLGAISKLDQSGDYSTALNVVSKAVINNRKNTKSAVELSQQLEIMAINTAKIKPDKAKELAISAISSEVALVSRLLKYNGYLAELFELLKLKFSVKEFDPANSIQELVVKLNDEAKAVNSLNDKFNSLMAEFDALVVNSSEK